MQLRRFTAESTPEALGAVRLALGDDAIILANRKIGDQVEIIATEHMADAEALAKASVSAETSVKGSTENERHDTTDFQKNDSDDVIDKSGSSAVSRDSFQTAHTGTVDLVGETKVSTQSNTADALTIEQLKAAIEAVEKRSEQLNAVNIPMIADSNTQNFHQNDQKDIKISDEPDRHDMSRQSLESKGEPLAPVAQQSEPSIQRSDLEKITREVTDSLAAQNELLMKTIQAQNDVLNRHFKGLEVNLWGNHSPSRREHLQQLLSIGLGAELAVQLVERAPTNYSVQDALRHSFALLKSTLPIGCDKSHIVPGVTIVSGPPGAGKTTVLMKLATEHVKANGADSIVVICADTRRIGAFEELQAYGRLAGVPTVHAHDTAEFDSLVSAFTHKQLVLVDHTLPMDEDAVEIPEQLLHTQVQDSVRHLLVLSATSQSSMIDSLVARHCLGRKMQCVLTHLDANARLGEMFNPLIRHHLPIAYWSDAASIQTPLQKADASILIATAVAMSRRLKRTADDDCLLELIQPTIGTVLSPVHTNEINEVITK